MDSITAQRLSAHPKITLEWFKKHIAEKGYTKAQLRCDVSPTAELLELMDDIGLNRYESWITRLGYNS